MLSSLKKLPLLYWSLQAKVLGARSLIQEVYRPRGWDPAQLKRLCVFAQYSSKGFIPDHTREYCAEIQRQGFQIVLVSTSQIWAEDDRRWMERAGILGIRRRNVSLDFGSWKTAFEFLGWDRVTRCDELWLANDSVYGPFAALDPIFKEMRARPLDVWGLTESIELGLHLQSYFLVLSAKALESPFFGSFFGSYGFPARKNSVIRAGELAFSSAARRFGLRSGAWIPVAELPDSRNSTLFHWDELISRYGFPFIKTEILRKNRFGFPGVKQWEQAVLARFPDCRLNSVRKDLAAG